MKLTVQHFDIPSTHVVDKRIEEGILALQSRLRIDEAKVRLEYKAESSPPFHVSVHLVTPGPDLEAGSREHTIRAAIDRVMEQLERQAIRRALQSKQRVRSGIMGRRAS